MNLLDNPIIKDPNYGKKILLFDIETAPNLGAYFELYREGNIVWVFRDWFILSIAYKYLGEKQTQVMTLPDFPGYKKDKINDEKLVSAIWKLFDQAEVLIAHNGDQFDIKKCNARFLKHGLSRPSPYYSIDTKKLAKKYFKFDSNKLDDLAKYLGVGSKLRVESGVWKGCIEGDMAEWRKMKAYNKQDVDLLEKVYLKLRGWHKGGPNMNLVFGTAFNCPQCAGTHTRKNGYANREGGIYQKHDCLNCGAHFLGEKISKGTKIYK